MDKAFIIIYYKYGLRMFDWFNLHLFQSLKLSILKADMVKMLHPVTGMIFKSRRAKG